MCGIGGAITADSDRGQAIAAHVNSRQNHRGPDHAVSVPLGPFIIANTRLAIQDPTPAGNQPFWSADGRYVCVFNGEIYNFVELIERHRLELANHCDGAVIPELWARTGAASLRELRGMFAIALVDTHAQTLVLARDPFGIKPLYHRHLGDGAMAFASEVRSLTTLEPKPALHRGALARFLHLGAMGADQSPFCGLDAVPPNTVRTFQTDGTSTTAPILAGPSPLLQSDQQHRALGPAFTEAVNIHLRADVPTVLLLSSGVDSSAIASAARSLGRDLHCMTVGGMGGDPDESEGARVIAQHYGHSHQVVMADIDDHSVAAFFDAMQRPSIDGFNTFLVCRAVRKGNYRVALSGVGGDEALGGYAQYRFLPYLSVLRVCDKLPGAGRALGMVAAGTGRLGVNRGKVARLLARGGPRSAVGLDLLQREVLDCATVAALTGSPLESSSNGGRRDFAALVEAELEHYMQATLLPDADAYSMCSSVELRVPFVDRNVFASAVALNAGHRRNPGKRLLAEALDDPFLLKLTRKRKRGFTVPMTDWLERGPLQPVLAAVHGREAPVWDHLDRSAADAILSAPVGERWSTQWSLAALNAWLCSMAGESPGG